jgi:putative membrane protein
MDYNHIKAIHIIFVVSWFAGLFYLPRLFVYHTEANTKPELERDIIQEQFKKWKRFYSMLSWYQLCG